uniref:Uncharacterized protein n=1 Tax=Periophthalmus magnuspinnatus TaxID=409849 RepID=A0A3B3ZL62_9GOBI
MNPVIFTELEKDVRRALDTNAKAEAQKAKAHYDLAISVALWWLNREEGRYYPNHLEREAMILSSFAGMIVNKLPVEEILTLYKCKPAATYSSEHSKAAIVYPFTLSYHPFAMLSSYKAVHHSKKHSE